MTRYVTRWTCLGFVVGCIVGLAIGAGYWSLFAVLVGACVGWEVGLVVAHRPRRHIIRGGHGHVHSIRVIGRDEVA